MGRCLLHKMYFFRRHQTLCGTLKALCRVAAQFRLDHHCALRTSPPCLTEVQSIIQWPQMLNRQNPRPKYWEALICTFMQWAQLHHFFHLTHSHHLSLFVSFFTGPQSELVLNFSSPFPWFPVRHFPVNPSLYLDETLVCFLLFPEFHWVLLASLNNSVVVV